MYNSKISGLGFYVPDRVVTNDDMSKVMNTSDEWIQERTGIKERRHIVKGGGDTTSSMGYKAAKLAIERAGISKHDIEFIIFATLSPDYYFPGPGVMVQHLLGIGTVGALDVRNQCSGFLYALSVADQYVKTGHYKNILVIGSEVHSPGLDMTTRGRAVSVLFADGAGAAVISREEDLSRGILSTHLHSEGEYARELSVISPGLGTKWITDFVKENDSEDTSYYPYMNGQLVFKNASIRLIEVVREGLAFNKLSVNDIDLLIPHQANLRVSQFVQREFSLPDHKIYNNIMKYGNTTAASIPIALSEAWEQNRLKTGDLLVLAAFGSGFTWASTIIRW